jgi:hypothetical protein
VTTPNITVTVDTTASTYEFTTDPYVKPPEEPLPVDYQGSFTIKAGGKSDNITIVATIPSTATVTVPFDPAMDPVTTTVATYTLKAIGKVTLSVPDYGGRPLTGEPLMLAPVIVLTLEESNPQTSIISFGGLITLVIDGITSPVLVDVPAGLFVDQGPQVTVAPGGTTYTIADVDEGPYEVSYEDNSRSDKLLIPLIGTINVSSTKKPHA